MKGSGFLIVCLSLTLFIEVAQAETDVIPDIITLTLENDLFVNEDNGYTNGTFLSWARDSGTAFSAESMPGWLASLGNSLYIGQQPNKHRGVSYLLGQAMQTPNDIREKNLLENDVPYVGMLLWRGTLHAYDDRVADRFSVVLGLVGPASGAKKTQKLVHKLVDADDPKGWGNQLHNELAFQLNLERAFRLKALSVTEKTAFDLIGIGSVAVGTLNSNIATGLSLRFGTGLDRSFPTATILPGREINPLAGTMTNHWNIFFNLRGEYVANDLSIDGNTFEDSHSVPLEHWQRQAVVGFSFNLERWAFLFSTVWAEDRHKLQQEQGNFGSLSVTYHF